jgi:hypothetical protein
MADIPKPRNVFRIDIEPSESNPRRHPTHGWQVRVKRHHKQHTKYFSDKRYGSRDAALDAAVAYRDTLIEDLPDPLDAAQLSARARSKTGVVGLNFCWKDDGSRGRKPYVQVSWIDNDGRRRSAGYSVRKWKLRPAVWMACERLNAARLDQDDRTAPGAVTMFETAYPTIRDTYLDGCPSRKAGEAHLGADVPIDALDHALDGVEA